MSHLLLEPSGIQEESKHGLLLFLIFLPLPACQLPFPHVPLNLWTTVNDLLLYMCSSFIHVVNTCYQTYSVPYTVLGVGGKIWNALPPKAHSSLMKTVWGGAPNTGCKLEFGMPEECSLWVSSWRCCIAQQK